MFDHGKLFQDVYINLLKEKCIHYYDNMSKAIINDIA